MDGREQLLSQMVDHQILITDRLREDLGTRDKSWFDIYGRNFDPSAMIYPLTIRKSTDKKTNRVPDLWAIRAVAAHYLGMAHHPPVFFCDHRFDNPKPTESDRLLYTDWVEFCLTMTGLLNSQEIQKIRSRGWWNEDISSIPPELINKKDANLSNFEEVCEKIALWKKEGWKVALFHGAFDPVTLTHLENATHAYSYGPITGTPLKLVIGFDSDELIQRKGKNRPRYQLDERRSQFGAFWMVDGTVVLRTNKPTTEKFASDYLALGVDYIVTTNNPHEISTRRGAILRSCLEPIIIPENPLPNATQILQRARSRKL
ncbi:MAG: hypothetical protein AAB574_02195 [Patescibacteria group bacterium]